MSQTDLPDFVSTTVNAAQVRLAYNSTVGPLPTNALTAASINVNLLTTDRSLVIISKWNGVAPGPSPFTVSCTGSPSNASYGNVLVQQGNAGPLLPNAYATVTLPAYGLADTQAVLYFYNSTGGAQTLDVIVLATPDEIIGGSYLNPDYVTVTNTIVTNTNGSVTAANPLAVADRLQSIVSSASSVTVTHGNTGTLLAAAPGGKVNVCGTLSIYSNIGFSEQISVVGHTSGTTYFTTAVPETTVGTANAANPFMAVLLPITVTEQLDFTVGNTGAVTGTVTATITYSQSLPVA